MLSILVNWIYIVMTSFVIGFGVLWLLGKCLKYSFDKPESYLFAGLITVTAYAQVFNLFAKVGLLANCLLLLVTLIILILLRVELYGSIRKMIGMYSRKRALIVGVLFLIFAYGTSRGYMLYDSSLYHGQSIRWIEEYKTILGLGNLHVRLAYNSASFSLSALYSMAFMGGQSLHGVSGLFAWILSIMSLDIVKIFSRKKLVLSDFARVGAIYYLTLIYSEIVSPSSDYFVMITLFYIIITWLDLLEKKEQSSVPYSLLCVAGVYAVSLKLSAGLILFLLIKPIVMLLKGKEYKAIGIYLTLGILVIAPFFIRNVLLSGWLVYPLAGIDLFAVDWKIPASIAAYDAKEIQVWGRALYDVSKFDLPITQWFANWFFTGHTKIEQVFIAGSLLSLIAIPIMTVIVCVKKQWEKLDFLLVYYALGISFIAWLFSAPLLRYGYTYVLLLPLLVFGGLYIHFVHKKSVIIFITIVAAFFAYKAIRLGQEAVKIGKLPYYIHQQEYEEFPTTTYQIGDYTIYRPIEGDRVGYQSFPSSPTLSKALLRGERIEDGFYMSKH